MSIHVLLNKILFLSRGTVYKGFIFFNNEEVIDQGEEPHPEYELSELVISYDYRGFALHGFSLATSLSNYPFRGLNSFDLSTYSVDEIKSFIYAGFYELLMNGVTLPIIIDEKPELVNRVAKEHDLKTIIIHEEGTIKHYQGINYIEIKDEKLYFNGEEIGDKNIFCTIKSLTEKCSILDISGSVTFNVSSIINYLLIDGYEMNSIIKLLTRPYKLLGFDHGVIDIKSEPDILVYDLKNSLKTVPYEKAYYSISRGYQPDQVFIQGDLFFDHGEPLVLTPRNIEFILFGERST
ncbi:MAG: hypothetical protein B6U89_01045 [Desulfurococcales archaeon ex4484_58]|nr:MAG: hypothetical protein B6U89_01045 [Desulfurococcales archaeon ex4484_58]